MVVNKQPAPEVTRAEREDAIYSIATMREIHRHTELEYVKDGNGFIVYYQNNENGERAKRRFDTAAEAAKAFQKIAGWMLLGLYSDKDRCSCLETGTMD